MEWRDIPSLSALRAFEVAARLGSYSQAARELNVTHAAVAQHVRALEERFGQSLMERSGRGVEPTAAGARLAEDLGRGFAEIAAGVRSLDAIRGQGPLSITTTRTFAENWLMPRLPGFWAAHPEIPLTIAADDSVLDLRRSGHHLAIRYSAHGKWPGLEARFLSSGRSILVAHPDLAARIDPDADRIAELQKLPWLIENAFTDFRDWIVRIGVDLSRAQVSCFDGNPLVLAGTRAGGGVSAQPEAVIMDDLEAGRLVRISVPGDEAPSYNIYTATPQGPVPDRVRVFERWLRREMG